jgi:hypothetical protein
MQNWQKENKFFNFHPEKGRFCAISAQTKVNGLIPHCWQVWEYWKTFSGGPVVFFLKTSKRETEMDFLLKKKRSVLDPSVGYLNRIARKLFILVGALIKLF